MQVVFYLHFRVSRDDCVAKILLAARETFSYENNCNHDSYKLSKKFAFTHLFSFCKRQKQEPKFHHISGLTTKNI